MDLHDRLYTKLFREKKKFEASDVRRFVCLACALEPLSNKPGCTTRFKDLNKYQKLEYFITGAINIGDSFYELASRIRKRKKQLIYDFAYRAQADCKQNRAGGRVNQGIIEMLIPIVSAQIKFGNNQDGKFILKKSVEIMKSTSRKDVSWLIKMKRLAFDLSGYFKRKVPNYFQVNNVYDYYCLETLNSKTNTSLIYNSEFVKGFPVVLKIYRYFERNSGKSLSRVSREIYLNIRKKEHKEVSAGVTADCFATGLYLFLSKNLNARVIR